MEYENTRRVVYEGGMQFLPICPNCGRYVKADEKLETLYNEWTDESKIESPNATCKKCGRVQMFFEGYLGN
jgi:uncharacterized Zn finger protein